MHDTNVSILVVSQLFFTLFGSLMNVMIFIILRDVPNLASSSYNVLILNLAFCNLISCTIVKPMASIFISFAYAQVAINPIALECVPILQPLPFSFYLRHGFCSHSEDVEGNRVNAIF